MNRTLVVDIARHKAPGGKTNWDGVAAEMTATIAKLADPADLADHPDGGFIQANRETLELMFHGNRQVWSAVKYNLNKRARVLAGGEL